MKGTIRWQEAGRKAGAQHRREINSQIGFVIVLDDFPSFSLATFLPLSQTSLEVTQHTQAGLGFGLEWFDSMRYWFHTPSVLIFRLLDCRTPKGTGRRPDQISLGVRMGSL